MDATEAKIVARGTAEIAVILTLAGIVLWCLYGFVTSALAEEPGRVQFGWWLGLAASRLAQHDVTRRLREARADG